MGWGWGSSCLRGVYVVGIGEGRVIAAGDVARHTIDKEINFLCLGVGRHRYGKAAVTVGAIVARFGVGCCHGVISDNVLAWFN